MTGNSGSEQVRIFDHGSQDEIEVDVPTQGSTFETSSSRITITFLNDGNTNGVSNDVFLTSDISFTVENEYRWNQWGCEHSVTEFCERMRIGELKWGIMNEETEEGGIYEVYFGSNPPSSRPSQIPTTISNVTHTGISLFLNKTSAGPVACKGLSELRSTNIFSNEIEYIPLKSISI